MMQIRELVLYGYNGKVRHLPFSLGQVNIITGRSKSGKSAVGDIIDYCLGGESCNIADGVVRDNVAWYGLLLQFEHERMFVARKNPGKGQQSTGYCYFEVGEKIEVPEECNFESNTNVSGIEEELTGRIGISENLNVPPDGQSRLPLAANIRHSLYYCIQGQDEIAAKNFLFHHQSDDFITQAIKDTIPYFLGAISEEALALENERYILNRKLKLEKRKLEENRYLMGGGSERAITLIGEARQVGLIDSSIQIDYQLKLFVKSNSDSNANYAAKKAELEREAAQCREMLADPMACTMKLYERLICKELDKDTYLTEKAKVYAAKERLEKVEAELEINKRRHEALEAMHRVLRKELPLAEILGSIDSIVVSEGRKTEVKWREMC